MSELLKIGIDAGGDTSVESIKGAIMAAAESRDYIVLLYGSGEEIDTVWLENAGTLPTRPLANLILEDCGNSRATALKESVHDLASGEIDALITASNSRRLDVCTHDAGMWQRPYLPALISPLPTRHGIGYFLDAGATSRVNDPSIYANWVAMGVRFLQNLGFDQPRVGLANIASERGAPEIIAIRDGLAAIPNFVGLVEPKQFVWDNQADLWVMDGFTGNLILKTLEAYMELLTASHAAAVAGYQAPEGQPTPAQCVITNAKTLFSYEAHLASPYLTPSGQWLFRVHGSAPAALIAQAFALVVKNYNLDEPIW